MYKKIKEEREGDDSNVLSKLLQTFIVQIFSIFNIYIDMYFCLSFLKKNSKTELVLGRLHF